MEFEAVLKGVMGRSNKQGFTILETMLATAYLMTCLVFLFSFFSSSGKNTMDSYHESIAYLLAQEGLDLVSGTGYDALASIAAGKTAEMTSLPGNLTNFVMESNPCSPWVDDNGSPASYPRDYQAFNRVITVEFVPEKTTAGRQRGLMN